MNRTKKSVDLDEVEVTAPPVGPDQPVGDAVVDSVGGSVVTAEVVREDVQVVGGDPDSRAWSTPLPAVAAAGQNGHVALHNQARANIVELRTAVDAANTEIAKPALIRETTSGEAFYYMDGATKRFVTGTTGVVNFPKASWAVTPAPLQFFGERTGNNCRITVIGLNKNVDVTATDTLYTLPVGWKPSDSTTRLIYAGTPMCGFSINASGQLRVADTFTARGTYSFTLEYTTKDPWPPSTRDDGGAGDPVADGETDGAGDASEPSKRATRSRKPKTTA